MQTNYSYRLFKMAERASVERFDLINSSVVHVHFCAKKNCAVRLNIVSVWFYCLSVLSSTNCNEKQIAGLIVRNSKGLDGWSVRPPSWKWLLYGNRFISCITKCNDSEIKVNFYASVFWWAKRYIGVETSLFYLREKVRRSEVTTIPRSYISMDFTANKHHVECCQIEHELLL